MAIANPTRKTAASQTYVVQSKGYDLGTLNAGFSSAPTVTGSTPSDSSFSVSYAGSADGASYSSFTSNILDLSGKSYRYLKFKITFTTASTAATDSPSVSSIAIDYSDLGLDKLDVKLSAGCGTLTGLSDDDRHRNAGPGVRSLFSWLLFALLAWRWMRYGLVRKVRRAD
jgi:hypothetical protein